MKKINQILHALFSLNLLLSFNIFCTVNISNNLNSNFSDKALIFAGNSNLELANKVARCLNVELGKSKIGRFNDGEIQIQIEENVRSKDIFIIQPTCSSKDQSVNDNFMELCLMIRTFKRSSASSITTVIPYYGYARQDRKSKSRVPISAADIAYFLEQAGATRVVTIDLHTGQIQGFFQNIPVDNLYASIEFAQYIADKKLEKVVVVSPDAGGVERANQFIHELSKKGVKAELAMISKQRAQAGVISSMNLIGDVKDSHAIIIDDICDTGGTLVKGAQLLKDNSAKEVYALITHPVFSGVALDIIGKSCIKEIIISDTIPLRREPAENIKIVSIAPLLANAISRIQSGESVSELFK